MKKTNEILKAFAAKPSRISYVIPFTPSNKKIKNGIENFRDLSKDDISNFVLSILKKPGKLRSSNDIAILSKCLLSVKFFEDRKEDYGQFTIDECCKNLFSQKMSEGMFVFSIGTYGSSFYIILKGRVSVMVKGDHADDLKEVKILKSGDCFGELALLENRPRAATIKCLENCHFAVLEKEAFDKIIRSKERKVLYENIEYFASLWPFRRWTFGAIKKIFYLFSIQHFQRNHPVYSVEDPSDFLYIVKTGNFKSFEKSFPKSKTEDTFEEFSSMRSLRNKKSLHENLMPIGILAKGEIFGDEEILDGCNRKYTVICDSLEGSVYKLAKRDFLKFVAKDEETLLLFKRNSLKKSIWRKQMIKKANLPLKKETLSGIPELKPQHSQDNLKEAKVDLMTFFSSNDKIYEIKMRNRMSQFRKSSGSSEFHLSTGRFSKMKRIRKNSESESNEKRTSEKIDSNMKDIMTIAKNSLSNNFTAKNSKISGHRRLNTEASSIRNASISNPFISSLDNDDNGQVNRIHEENTSIRMESADNSSSFLPLKYQTKDIIKKMRKSRITLKGGKIKGKNFLSSGNNNN